MHLKAGTRLGPYEIVAPIGAGGMGEVYRARDTRLDRDVAVKVLPEHMSRDPQALARFDREAKAVAALSHPNLLAIFDTGHQNGTSYAVTELLEGESLRSALYRGPMPWRRAVEIGGAIAEGLSAAHAKGITHRDIKPENIFLTTDDRVKILDFGVARMEAHGGTQTSTGFMVGTPGYMSPEQIRGLQAGPASDIYSLGCVLYEMCSGQRPSTGTEIALASIPPDLARLIHHCLQPDPAQRFQSARDVASHLHGMLSTAGAKPAAIDSIAVLPFTNAGEDPDTEYLCEGLTETILNSMSQIGQLRVVPRSTVFRYKGRDLDPQAIGRELNVRAVLTGRVSHRGERLVVGTELLDVQAGSQLWGERYNRKISDIFEIEEEISRQISDSLRMRLSGEEKKRLAKRFTEDSEAYQLYLRGRHHWNKRAPQHLQKAIDYFQQAIDRDPAYAMAYAGLADCNSILGMYSVAQPKAAFARAKAAAAAAVAMDDELAEAHTSLGFIRAFFDYDWAGADRSFRRALELSQSYWVAPYWYGLVLSGCGRFREAEVQIAHAARLEPLSPIVAHCDILNLYFERRYAEAYEASCRAVEAHPDHFLVRQWLAVTSHFMGRIEESIAAFESAIALGAGHVSWVVASLGTVHALAGNAMEARRILDEILSRDVFDSAAPLYLHVALGETDQALHWAEKACDERGLLPLMIKNDPRIDPLRSEPRFQAVLRRMNLGD